MEIFGTSDGKVLLAEGASFARAGTLVGARLDYIRAFTAGSFGDADDGVVAEQSRALGVKAGGVLEA
jgi:hypothetical protein